MIDTVHGNKSVALWRVNIKWFVPFLSPFFNARGVAIVCFCLSVSYISMDFNRAHLLNLGSWQFPSKTVYSYHIGLDLVTAIFLDIPSISLTPNVPDLEKPLRPLIRLFALLPFRWKVLAVRPAISKVLCTFPSSQWNNGIFQEMSDRSGGYDSLPLVPLFTRKQHDSPLSYAVHFLQQNIPPNVLRWGKS